MRHGDRTKKLGRTGSHRLALVRNLVSALIQHERIRTTLPKAREAQRTAERLLRLALANTLAARRQAARVVSNRTLVKKLFDDIGPRLAGRAGGYTRLYRLGHRPGDSAEVGLLEFVVRKRPESDGEVRAKGGKRKNDKPDQGRSRLRREGQAPVT
uniref:Large ribosomal subunit protein bL17 n=1 Tax=candidate division WOR-3 bacterium TaxID=2052148 RepID=A0A7C4CDB5_UNCW3